MMDKNSFIIALREKLKGLPTEDIERSVEYYKEMIDDQIEEGIPEEEAVSSLGNIDDIVQKILADTPITKIVKDKLKPKKDISPWVIALLVLGSPVWFPIIFAIFITVFSVYISVWAVLISLFATAFSLIVVGIVGSIISVGFFFQAAISSGGALLGIALALIGSSILITVLCKITVKLLITLTQKSFLGLKKLIIGKAE